MFKIIILLVVLLLKGITAIEDDSYGVKVDRPGASCADIYEKNPASRGKSGLYLVKTDKLFLAQCDMEFEKGWMQVADLNVGRGDECPQEWTKITVQGVEACRSPNDKNGGCYSKHFLVNGTRYRKVRGLVRGYQKGTVDGFFSGFNSINNVYADGVSITLGNPRKHVWTYVAGCSDAGNHPSSNCPCASVPGSAPPSFVGEHYYCESGNTGNFDFKAHYMMDPLWDGAGCGDKSNCCTAVGQPWFYREFPTMQNEDIEVRICTNSVYADEAVLVDQINIFIQ